MMGFSLNSWNHFTAWGRYFPDVSRALWCPFSSDRCRCGAGMLGGFAHLWPAAIFGSSLTLPETVYCQSHPLIQGHSINRIPSLSTRMRNSISINGNESYNPLPLVRGTMDAIFADSVWVDVICSVTIYYPCQSWYPLLEHWFKEVSTHDLPALCQFIFQIVLARDYLLFYLFFCIVEELKWYNDRSGEDLSSLSSRQNTLESLTHYGTWSCLCIWPVGSCQLSAWRLYFPWITMVLSW
jgi:hypothetical protein